MGVITALLLLPITGPVRGFQFVLERLRDEAQAVLLDEGRAVAELIDLSMRHNAGQLTDGEYEEQEAELLERLSAIREYRDELLNDRADGDVDEEVYAAADVDEDVYAEADLDEAFDAEAELNGEIYAEADVDEERW